MIRKNIASALVNLAVKVEEDMSKERIQRWVHDTRVKMADAIQPKD